MRSARVSPYVQSPRRLETRGRPRGPLSFRVLWGHTGETATHPGWSGLGAVSAHDRAEPSRGRSISGRDSRRDQACTVQWLLSQVPVSPERCLPWHTAMGCAVPDHSSCAVTGLTLIGGRPEPLAFPHGPCWVRSRVTRAQRPWASAAGAVPCVGAESRCVGPRGREETALDTLVSLPPAL